MKHLALFLCLLWLVPVCGLCETILWEDEAGQVILGDDGNVQFISPDGEAADENYFVPTAFPAETPASIETPAQTEAPAPIEPIDFTFKGTLKYGDSGERVAQLQTRLSELGFYNAKVSGGYYKVTKAAVKAFQAHNGLSADGIAGRDTQELLFSAAAVPAEATPRPSPTPEPAKYTLMVDVVNQITRAYTYDEDGQYTVLVREMICSTGTSKYPTPCKTTIMPKKRARWGYFPTWGSHAQYLTRIDAANAFHSVLYSEPNENTLSVKSFDALGTPASHGCVRLLVSDAKWIYENCKEGTIITVYEGDYDPEYTMTLKPTLNASTLRENPLPAPTATPAYVPENWPTQYRTLSRGKKGEDVYMLQMRLTELGYYHGSITGSFGSLTKQAVRKFQDANKLTVDGVAGPATINKLRSLTGGSADSGSSSGSTVTTDKSYGKITKDNVYLRSSYSTSSSAKASLSSGKLVRITKTYTVGGVKWYYITVNIGSYTYNGYVRSDMMTTISEAEYNKEGGDSDNSAGDQETIGMIKVTGNNVSLRYQPSTSANRVGTANIGDCFYYVDTVDGWFQTRSGYWISRSYAAVMTDEEVKAYIKNNGGSGNTGSNYTLGSTGSTVSYIQTALTALEYYDRQITGHYGRYTKDAVRAFQRDNNLTADGVCGAATLAAIQKAYSGSSSATTTYNDTFYDLNNWFTDKARMNALGLKRDAHCKMTDLRTGKSLNIYIQSTGNHADVEPLTAADTTTLCEIYGVSSADKIGWEARPILITVDKYQFICSIYGEAHGAEVIKDNNYSGQFCLHFTGSKTHNSGETLDRHKKAIAEAATILTKMGKKLQKGTP